LQDWCSDSRSRVVFVLAFVSIAPHYFIFLFADALRLQQMERERKSHVEAFPAKPAPNGELEQSETGQI
jgi:hypothetical protein